VHEKATFSTRDLIRFLVSKKNIWINTSFIGYAFEARIGEILWPIFLLLLVGSLKVVGGLYSLTFLFSLLVLYFVGKATDKRGKRELIARGTFLHSLGWVARLFVFNPLTVFLADSFKNMAQSILHIPWCALSYDIAKKQNYFEFIVAREIVFKGARVVLFPLVILLFYTVGFNFKLVFLLAAISSLFYVTIIHGQE